MRSGRQAERRPAARAPRYITAPGQPGSAAPYVGTGGRQDVLLHRDLLAFQHQVRVAEAALLSEGAEGPQQPRRVLGIRHGARSRHAARPGPAARKHLALCRAAPRRPPQSVPRTMADVINPRRPSGRERRRRRSDAPLSRQRPCAERSGDAGGLAALLEREEVTSGLDVIIRNVRCLCFEPDRQDAGGLHARLRSTEQGELPGCWWKVYFAHCWVIAHPREQWFELLQKLSLSGLVI